MTRPGEVARGGGTGIAASSEEVGEGSCTSSGIGMSLVFSSTRGVWYKRSVGGEEGGEGEEASCL